MEESMNTAAESVESETSLEQAFEDGWNDESEVSFEGEEPAEADFGEAEGGDQGEETDPAGETSQQEEAPAESTDQTATTEETPQEQAQQPASVDLDFYGEKRTVSTEEAKNLAQMGLFYRERVQKDYEELKPVIALARKFAAEAGMTPAQYAAWTEANNMVSTGEAKTHEEARAELARRQREERIQAWENQRQAENRRVYEAKARRDADIQNFARTYPDVAAKLGPNVDPETVIPREVWEAVNNGQTLTAAYGSYALKQSRKETADAKAELAAFKKNNANRSASTGSMSGSGTPGLGNDPFLEGWNEPDP